MKKHVLLGVCLLSLAGCDAIKNMTSPKVEEPAVAVVDPADTARETFVAETVIVPSASLGDRLAVRKGVTGTFTDHNTLLVTAAPDVPVDSTKKTSGASIMLTPEQEATLSNSKATFKILARSGNGGTVKARVAYSTNEVGNSKFRDFEVGPEYSVFSFQYTVAPMKEGAGDYIGFLPADGPIEIAAIGIDSKKKAAPRAPAEAVEPAPATGTPE